MALSDVAGITHGAARSSAGKPWKAAGGATTTRVSTSARTSSLRAYLDLAAPAHGARPQRLLTVAALSSSECPWKRDGWAYFSRASTTTRLSTSTRTSSLPAYLDLAAPAHGVRPRRLLTVAALSSEEYPCKREGWTHLSRASSSRRPHALRAHLDPEPRRFVTVVGPSSAEKAGKREGCAYSSRSPAQARVLQPLPELPPLPRPGAHAARTGRLFVGGAPYFTGSLGPSSAEKAGKREGCAYSSRSVSSLRFPAQARVLQPLPRPGTHAARTARFFVGGAPSSAYFTGSRRTTTICAHRGSCTGPAPPFYTADHPSNPNMSRITKIAFLCLLLHNAGHFGSARSDIWKERHNLSVLCVALVLGYFATRGNKRVVFLVGVCDGGIKIYKVLSEVTPLAISIMSCFFK